MAEQRTILAMADANFLAHVSRVLEISRILRDAYGYRIVFGGSGKFVKLFSDAGFQTEEAFTVDGQVTLDLAKKAGLVRYGWWRDMAMETLESDLEVIERIQPDVIMGDMRWTAGPAARSRNLPYISVTNAAWTNYYAATLRHIPDHFLTNAFGESFCDVAMPFFKKIGVGFWGLPLAIWQYNNAPQCRQWRNMALDLFDIIRGDLTLFADIPEYYPLKAKRPESFHYVGPILWSPDMPRPEWIDELDPHRPVVYVTMGSTGHGRFFKAALETFANTEYQVVMTTGNYAVDFGEVPSNFTIVPFAPGLDILERADVTINHSGNGSVYQALKAGVPIVGIPTHIDQEMNAQRIEDLGVGVKLRESTLTPEVLRSAVDRVIAEPLFRQHAERISCIIDSYNGPATSARLIDQFLTRRFASELPNDRALSQMFSKDSFDVDVDPAEIEADLSFS